jgi:hypothetical protein
MSLDRAVMAFAGCVVLVSLALGHYVSPYWHLLTAFAGLNMVQAAPRSSRPLAEQLVQQLDHLLHVTVG